MTSTTNDHVSTSQGACVFCNTVRPIEETLCPACGRGWIDTSAADAAGSVARAESVAVRSITTGAAPETRRSTYHRSWWVPIVIAAVVFGGYWGAVSLVGDDDAGSSGTLGAPTTLSPTTTAPLQSPPTTLPTSTTASTTSTTTTSTTPSTTIVAIEPGEPVAIDELRLGAVELGAFPFGMPADELLPRLAGTFGQPDAEDPPGAAWGLCTGDSGRVLTFGGLEILIVETGDAATFAGFAVTASGDRTDELLTFSGVGVGSTIAELDAIYPAFHTTVTGSSTTWIVASVNDGRTLLWGTADGVGDDARVDRIASPRVCDGGPAA